MRLFTVARNENIDPASVGPNSSDMILAVFDRQDSQIGKIEIPDHESPTLESALGSDAAFVGILTREMLNLIASEPSAIFDRLASQDLSLIILVQRACPPDDVRRYDGIIETFLCSYAVWAEKMANGVECDPRHYCYEFVSSILSNNLRVDWISVFQLPLNALPTSQAYASESIALIMAHRGHVEYLGTAIKYARALHALNAIHMYIGLDVEDISAYSQLTADPLLTCFAVHDPPAGPYVVRDALIRRSKEDLLLFQDSDDISCSDRATELCRTMYANDVDMVGSHEMEVNEIDKCIRVYRFPLNVSAVLSRYGSSGVSDNAAEPFLHATALMRRDKYLAAGGFSTNRRIANDSQFLLRAHFTLKIANADHFLYLRRVHPRALTISPLTRNGNSLRKSLSQQWGRDFKLVKSGLLPLADSSLRVETETTPHRISLFGLRD